MPALLNSIGLFSGISQKMDYLQTRQRVLSENMSNANTPGFQAKDVKAPDFAAVLNRTQTHSAGQPLALAQTSSGHIGTIGASNGSTLKSEVSRQTYEVTPEGNSVSLEEQMMKASQTAGDYQLVTNLYNKNLDILRDSMKN